MGARRGSPLGSVTVNGIGLTTPTETLFSDQIVRPRKIQLSKGNIGVGARPSAAVVILGAVGVYLSSEMECLPLVWGRGELDPMDTGTEFDKIVNKLKNNILPNELNLPDPDNISIYENSNEICCHIRDKYNNFFFNFQ